MYRAYIPSTEKNICTAAATMRPMLSAAREPAGRGLLATDIVDVEIRGSWKHVVTEVHMGTVLLYRCTYKSSDVYIPVQCTYRVVGCARSVKITTRPATTDTTLATMASLPSAI